MNEARDKTTGLIVPADDLKTFDSVDKYNYECPDLNCKIPLTASSFESHHKQRPHYRPSDQKRLHIAACEYSKLETFYKKARKGKVKANEYIKNRYPSKLVIPENKSTATEDRLNEAEQVASPQRTQSAVGNNTKQKTINQVVTALGKIVDFYLDCPSLRHLELALPELTTSYKYAFKKVEGINDGNQYKGRRIYYGILQVAKGALVENNDYLFIQLFNSVIIGEGKEQKKVNYQVKVSKEILSKRKITMIKNEITYVRHDSAAAYEENKKENKKDNRQPYVFFLADPPLEESPYQFEVVHGLLTAKYDEVLRTITL